MASPRAAAARSKGVLPDGSKDDELTFLLGGPWSLGLAQTANPAPFADDCGTMEGTGALHFGAGGILEQFRAADFGGGTALLAGGGCRGDTAGTVNEVFGSEPIGHTGSCGGGFLPVFLVDSYTPDGPGGGALSAIC